ncbi:hypothetical protein [Haloarcula marina]|uniref:hypothetical protein n=1 Tax=Haloarcula marina TaxID=2961574 RepID=UPI0020B79DD9|nr:hypothetical protein [Halomicroarcula marina]
MPYGLDLLAGAGAVAAVLGLVFLARFGVAYARSEDLEIAWDRTTKWAMTLAMGLGAAVSVGLIELGAVVSGGFEFIVGHPFVVSNLGVTGLGAGALSGLFTLSTGQFIGLALMLIGVVFVFGRVDEYVG